MLNCKSPSCKNTFQQQKRGPYICRCLLLRSGNARHDPCYPDKSVLPQLLQGQQEHCLPEISAQDRILLPPPPNPPLMVGNLRWHPGKVPARAPSLPRGSALAAGDAHTTFPALGSPLFCAAHKSQGPRGRVHPKVAIKILHQEVALTPHGARVQTPLRGEGQQIIGPDKPFIVLLSSTQS